MALWADRLAKLAQALSSGGVVPDANIDAAIARDSEVTTAVSTHAGASDPHADRSFATSAISTHAGAADPHTVYALESALGTLATQNGTFSGTSSGTNTGDQTLPTDATIATTDVTTNNVSTTKHGWAPKAPNDATKFLDGTGAYAVPPGTGLTNPMTTAADLIVGGASGVPARLAKGSDGQVLTVDPATHLLVWATPTGGGAPTDATYLTTAAHAGLSAEVVVPAAVLTVLDDTTVAAMVDTLGGASSTGTGGLVRATSPTLVTPALGTPASGVATNLTGTAASLTAGTVTTNANLTGDVTSVGNATTLITTKAPQAFGRTVHGGTTDYSAPGIVITATGNTAQIANNLVYMFYYTPTPITIDQVAFNVTTGPASNANVRVGIYAADTSWQCPTAPLADVTVAVASAFTGVKTITASATVNGRFIVAMNMDVAMTMRHWLGSLWTGSVDSALGTSNWIGSASVASTYGTMPSPGTAWTAALLGANGQVHNILVRISVP